MAHLGLLLEFRHRTGLLIAGDRFFVLVLALKILPQEQERVAVERIERDDLGQRLCRIVFAAFRHVDLGLDLEQLALIRRLERT